MFRLGAEVVKAWRSLLWSMQTGRDHQNDCVCMIVKSFNEIYVSFLFLHGQKSDSRSLVSWRSGFWQTLCTLTFKEAIGDLPAVVATAMCPVGMCPVVMVNGFLLFQRYGRLLSAVLLDGHRFEPSSTDTHECTDNTQHRRHPHFARLKPTHLNTSMHG